MPNPLPQNNTPANNGQLRFPVAEQGTQNSSPNISDSRETANNMENSNSTGVQPTPRRRSPRITLETKARLFRMLVENKSHSQIARELQIPRGTIASIVSREVRSPNTGTLEERGSRGRPAKLTPSIKERIVELVENNNTLTLKEIRLKIRESTNVNLAKSTVAKFLNDERITVKRTQITPVQRNSPSTILRRQEYTREYSRLARLNPGRKFVYLDESGFNMHLTRTRGRARPGISPVSRVPASPNRNLSLLQAISSEEVLYYEVWRGGINAERFKNFLRALSHNLPEGAMLVMDNASIHHANVVQSWLSENNLAYMFLPPYSPFLNPIEYSFGKIKGVVRATPIATEDDLIRAMENGISQITVQDLEGWYRKIQSFWDACEEGRVIEY